jgi:hypothetical protein
MIQIAAAVLLLLGSGLIFKALVEVDNPTARPRSLARRNSQSLSTDDEAAVPLRRAA